MICFIRKLININIIEFAMKMLIVTGLCGGYGSFHRKNCNNQ